MSEQISALDVDIGDAGASAVLQATLAEITAAEAALRTAAATDRGARAATAEARARLSEAVATEAAERRRFTETRDKVAALEPPGAGLEDLVSDWRALVDWAATMARSAESAAAEATREAGRLLDERTELTRSLVGRCAAAGIGGAGVAGAAEDVFEAVVDQVARVRADLARIDAEMAEAAGLRAEVRTHAGAAVVARDLARHLSANHFEKWVLDEALGLLVAGATDVLLDLSRGDYSLALDERSNFLVIDHRAADEVRSARTLSGGETFLASLALALALADQIGQLAAKGAARLESIFLDEGFGALDPDTLDTVAVAIEELGSRGRTVGLVTHLPELAERVPVRFDVVKGRATSTVVRTDT
ncbi:MAG: SbcC/MukB-like Walker B domain-containing protein [Acidimicrobiales bacterium]